MPLDTSMITQASFRPTRFETPSRANMLANVTQAVSGLQTLEANQMKMQQAQQQQAALEKMMAALDQAEAMGETDEGIRKYEAAFIQSRQPQFIELGMTMRQARMERARKKAEEAKFGAEYEQMFPSAAPVAAPAPAPSMAAETPMGQPVSLPTAPGAAPAAARAMPMAVEPMAVPRGRDLSEVNALAPALSAPANAMLAGPMVPGALPADPYAAQRSRLVALSVSDNPRVAERAKAELAQLPKPPEAPKEFAPSPLSRLMAERDALPSGDPRRAAYDAAIAKETTRAEPTRVEVKLPPQEREEQGARGKLLVKQYEAVSDAARLATRTLPSLDTQSNILDKGFKTGFGTDVQKAGASLLASLGVPEAAKFATDAQTFLAAAQQAVLQKQLEQKGVQTQADADRITQTGAQLGNTPEANRFIIDVTRAQLKRDIEQRNFYDKWWKENKTYDGAEDAWFSGEGGKSLFDRAELKKYGAARPAATAAPSTGVAPYGDAEKERRYQEWKSRQGAR